MKLTGIYEVFWSLEERFNRDKRVSHLPLVGSPWPMFGLMLLYVMFVRKWGPRLMKDRPPYDLRLAMIGYNIVQIVVNLYCFFATTKHTYAHSAFSWSCQEYNTEDRSQHLMDLRWPAYTYYLSKYLDFLDTVFFVLRKKERQITFLHVYHHASMVFCVWMYFTLFFGSHNTLIGVVNSFIHVLMYSYYLGVIVKPKANWAPWKQIMTKLQILQFCWMILHFTMPILNNWCSLDLFWIWFTLAQNCAFLMLFSNFYYRAYIAKAVSGAMSSASYTRNISKHLHETTGNLCKITEKVE